MKYSEFERTVKSMGLFINDHEGEIYVEDDSQFPVLTVSKLDEMVIDTEYPAFIELPYGKKDTLLILVVTLAKTPLAEREEEKRYYLQEIPVPLLDKEGEKKWLWKYTGRMVPSDVFGVDTDRIHGKLYTSIFTESEIAELDITGFEKVEVEE